MPTITNYRQFEGRHWETGSVHNYLAQRGFKAPHTGEPYSEALLAGVSGGIVVGYFTFAYEGYDPQCNILTRNTFDPLDTMLSRLGIIQELQHTRSAGTAVKNLIEALEGGEPAIVWADMWSLPYNALPKDEGMWANFPILVYGYEPGLDEVYIADRAGVPLTVTTETLAAARGRVKKDKYRLLTMDAPKPDKLNSAVNLGICDTIRLYTEKPPRGSKNNFGFNALQYWAKMLTQPKQRSSWEKIFPAGLPMYAGLTSAYNFAFLFGKGTAQDAERGMYADFLDEAAQLLESPALADVATLFRQSADAWGQLPATLLSNEVAPFKNARELMWRKHTLFLERGGDALEEIQDINSQLEQNRQTMIDDFPLTQNETVAYRERLAEQLSYIAELELEAIQQLKATMS